MDCRVFYESWQMQCCGDPVKINDKVSWLVTIIADKDKHNFIDEDAIDYLYDSHNPDSKIPVLVGTIARIRVLYEHYIFAPNSTTMRIPSDDKKLVEVQRVDGTEDSIEKFDPTGYVIDLVDCRVAGSLSKWVETE